MKQSFCHNCGEWDIERVGTDGKKMCSCEALDYIWEKKERFTRKSGDGLEESANTFYPTIEDFLDAVPPSVDMDGMGYSQADINRHLQKKHPNKKLFEYDSILGALFELGLIDEISNTSTYILSKRIHRLKWGGVEDRIKMAKK